MKDLAEFVPESLKKSKYSQDLIPEMAKSDGRHCQRPPVDSDHAHALPKGLPPDKFSRTEQRASCVNRSSYWNLNPYNGGRGQLVIIKDYEAFLDELDKVWQQALVLGGCLVCVVGDV